MQAAAMTTPRAVGPRGSVAKAVEAAGSSVARAAEEASAATGD